MTQALNTQALSTQANTSKANLAGKTALVTGGSRGIGAAIARKLATDGAAVAITYSSSAQQAEQLIADIRSTGGKALAIRADAQDADAVKQAVAKTVAEFGGLDILVNNAATNPVFGPIAETEEWAYDKIMQVNVKAPLELSKLVYPIMKANGGGSIINVSSVAGLISDYGLGLYAII